MAPIFPLRIEEHGRYLVDQAGVPFRLNMEAAWLIGYSATDAEITAYLDDRKARGFTAFAMMGMAHPGGYDDFYGMPGRVSYRDAPNNRVTGAGPFTTPGDFRQLNEPYWRRIDTIVDAARDRGMAVVLAYAYLGYQGGRQGWWAEINEPRNEDAMFGFGATLARRYRDRGNVIWYPAGDYSPPVGSAGSRRVRESILGIRSVIPEALFGAELNGPDDLCGDHADLGDLLNLETFYGYGPGGNLAVYETAGKAWAATPVRPALVGEPPYENIPFGSSGSRVDIRRSQYYAVLGGGTAGQNFGTSGVWNFNRAEDIAADSEGEGCIAFFDALDSPASNDMRHQFALYDSMPWHELRPAPHLIVAGQRGGIAHIAAAVTSSGSHLLAYVPPGRDGAFDVDLRALRGPVTATWFNPTTGTGTGGGADLPSDGGHSFRTPGDNGTGETDWVLVLTRPISKFATRAGAPEANLKTVPSEGWSRRRAEYR